MHIQGHHNRHYYSDATDVWPDNSSAWNAPPRPTQTYYAPQADWNPEYSNASWSAVPVYYDSTVNDDEELSSGHSHSESEIDHSDVAHMSVNQAGELLYLAYRGAKRRFRSFSRFGARKGKGKGRFQKGKGKGKGKGKQLFYTDGSPVEDEVIEPEECFHVYYKGKGKSGKGKGRTNPVGPDGKIMKCLICDSESHFRNHCPRKGQGKGNSGGKVGSASSSSGFLSHDAAATIFTASALHDLPVVAVPHSRITFSDGTHEVLEHTPSVNVADDRATPASTGRRVGFLNFVCNWWQPELAFHAMVRLVGNAREGLLIDCGAVTNLAGDRWVARTAALAKSFGQGTSTTAVAPKEVEGVGSGSSQVNAVAVVPVCLANGSVGSFETSVISNSELPALMGLATMTKNRALIDVANKKLIYVGPGGYQMQLSPNSITMNLEQVPSGHLLLPCAEWLKHKAAAAPASLQIKH